MKLILPEPPSANRYWRHAKGRTYLSKEALAYRDEVTVAWAAIRRADRKIKRLTGPVVFSFAWYRRRKSGDLDNRMKQLCDALRGYAYEDDKQIVEIHAYRFDIPCKAGVVVTVEPALQTPSPRPPA